MVDMASLACLPTDHILYTLPVLPIITMPMARGRLMLMLDLRLMLVLPLEDMEDTEEMASLLTLPPEPILLTLPVLPIVTIPMARGLLMLMLNQRLMLVL